MALALWLSAAIVGGVPDVARADVVNEPDLGLYVLEILPATLSTVGIIMTSYSVSEEASSVPWSLVAIVSGAISMGTSVFGLALLEDAERSWTFAGTCLTAFLTGLGSVTMGIIGLVVSASGPEPPTTASLVPWLELHAHGATLGIGGRTF